MNDSSSQKEPDSAHASIPSTLLDQVRSHQAEAWDRLVELYGPVIYGWCRGSGVESDEAGDVVQEVFTAVARNVGRFRRDGPSDSFRAWITTITRNKINDYFRRLRRRPDAWGGTDAQREFLDMPEPTDPSLVTNSRGSDDPLSRRALDLVRAEFEGRTWDAFWKVTVEDRLPKDVAEQLGMTLQAVYKAKSRVLRRLREEFGELLS